MHSDNLFNANETHVKLPPRLRDKGQRTETRTKDMQASRFNVQGRQKDLFFETKIQRYEI
jgi:hypothetical protein